MPRNRFQFIMQSLHFAADNEENINDKIWKIRKVFDMLNESFRTSYNLEREISIDESMMLWKGHHSLVRYVPSKASRWGFKFFCLAEASSGYISNMCIDAGSNTLSTDDTYEMLLKPGKVVLHLMAPFLGNGHLLGLDNYYTDIALFQVLHQNRTDAVGTLRANRRNIPSDIKEKRWKKKDKGKMIVRHLDDFLLLNWMDKKEVRIVSTVGSAEKRSDIGDKPQVVLLYNSVMPGVDLADQKHHGRKIARNRLKRWYKKFFFHLLDVALINGFVISRHVPNLAYSTHETFRLAVIRGILYKYRAALHNNVPSVSLRNTVSGLSGHTNIQMVQTHNQRKRCHVCKKKTSYVCVDCELGLCIVGCFHSFHTTLDEQNNV
jgi:hypothetical protein